MTYEQMLALIPTQSGLYFADCPNCTGGYQEGQFAADWEPTDIPPYDLAHPEQMRCKYCAHVYPSERYPMEEVLAVESPMGGTHRYPYWTSENGSRHFFAARLDYLKIHAMERAANALARMFVLTGEGDCARRSLQIIHRFGQVFPGYCYHFRTAGMCRCTTLGTRVVKRLHSNLRPSCCRPWDMHAWRGERATTRCRRTSPGRRAMVTSTMTG